MAKDENGAQGPAKLRSNGCIECLADLALFDDADWSQWMRGLHQMGLKKNQLHLHLA